MPAHYTYAILMLIAGIAIPLMASINANLGTRLGSPAAAATVLCLVASLTILAILILFNRPSLVMGIRDVPTYLLFGGCLFVVYVLSITYVAPKFGVGNAVFFVLLGQLISAAAIDHFGLFGAQVSPLNLTRAAGIAVMAFGVFLTQQA